jgi:AmmeMemoRadiSam system protein B
MHRGTWVLALAFTAAVATLSAQATRPIRDNVGFCWNMDAMSRLIDYLDKTAKPVVVQPEIAAAVSPHDDYLYAARVYYPLYRVLRARQVVIFGVTHGIVRQQMGNPRDILIMDDYSTWAGPRRTVAVSPLREYIKAHLDRSDFIVSDKAQALEHSIEAEVPFLQYYNPNVTIVPIMVTEMQWERMVTLSDKLSAIIADYVKANHLVLGKDIAFLVSSDADHYGEDFNNSPYGMDARGHEQATANDRRIAHECLDGVMTPEKMNDLTVQLKDIVWCGKYAIPVGLLTAEKTVAKVTGKHLEGGMLRYSDSYTESVLPVKDTGMGTTAPASYRHWCGWLSAAYYAK